MCNNVNRISAHALATYILHLLLRRELKHQYLPVRTKQRENASQAKFLR